MRNKKSRFLAFIFSFMPGAGHMYLGFMKMGLSLMGEFFFLIFLANFFRIDSLIYILPLVWCYSFFDCINKCSLNDEEFAYIEDRYLIDFEYILRLDRNKLKKSQLAIGVIGLAFGVYLLCNIILNNLAGIISQRMYIILFNIFRTIPQVLISIVIIIVGGKLIIGKKRESENND